VPALSGQSPRIGVYVCHCGANIAQFVDVPRTVEFARKLPNVVLARDYQFMCSDPGQDMIKEDIAEQRLERVVVASCSPLMHEKTFRKACREGGLNEYLFQMANIREQCSWVTDDKARATAKAEYLIAAAVHRVAHHEPLEAKRVPVNPKVLVVGGGIAGIEAALQIADAGKQVVLVEKDASIGGHMAGFDKTFPTLDCAACILTPKMVSVGQHDNIRLVTFAEVVDVSGHVGNFKVTVRKRARYVNVDECNGCGLCYQHCPAHTYPSGRVMSLAGRPFKTARFGVRKPEEPITVTVTEEPTEEAAG
jgi:heterodisulfide reductase subunit A